MATAEHCNVPGCKQKVSSSLEGQSLCRKHFISACYVQLAGFEEMRKRPCRSAADAESMRRFIHECVQRVDELERAVDDLNNLDRTKLLHITLSANELGRHLRRSPRKAVSIAVRLSSEKVGDTWEIETETELISQHGASMQCHHPAKPGETLRVIRSDTGQNAEVRVVWQRPASNDDVRIGVEFVDCQNFWGLDWSGEAAIKDTLSKSG